MNNFLFPYALFLLVIAFAGGIGASMLLNNEPVPFDSAQGKPAPIAKDSKEKTATTTMFWVGEPGTAENDFISNSMSYWDEEWQVNFGGVDTPECRSGYHPCGFTPKENPFYIALPYGERDENGNLKLEIGNLLPLKNRWIKTTHHEKTCYGQWEDVGPNNENDFAYVFGDAKTPTNTFGAHAGLDVSPALWKCLSLNGIHKTQWEFVDTEAVPDGPWKKIVTQ